MNQSCVVCTENTIDHMVMPCKHICLCGDCLKGIKICPICRCEALEIIKVFASGNIEDGPLPPSSASSSASSASSEEVEKKEKEQEQKREQERKSRQEHLELQEKLRRAQEEIDLLRRAADRKRDERVESVERVERVERLERLDRPSSAKPLSDWQIFLKYAKDLVPGHKDSTDKMGLCKTHYANMTEQECADLRAQYEAENPSAVAAVAAAQQVAGAAERLERITTGTYTPHERQVSEFPSAEWIISNRRSQSGRDLTGYNCFTMWYMVSHKAGFPPKGLWDQTDKPAWNALAKEVNAECAPNLSMNPHTIPSRMTIGQQLEGRTIDSLANKTICHDNDD